MAIRSRWRLVGLGVLVVAIAGAVAAGLYIQDNKRFFARNMIKLMQAWAPPPSPVGEGTRIESVLYGIEVTNIPAPVDPGQGGAIEAFDGAIFLVTRMGDFQRLDADGTAFAPIDIAPPEPVVTSGRFYERTKDFDGLGYRDLILRDAGADAVEVTLSRVRIAPDRDCVNLVVSRAVVDRGTLLTGTDGIGVDWTDIWESTPCIDDPVNTFPYQAGGDMVFAPDGRLMIFVGDLGMDLHNRAIPGIGPQQDGDDYGKVIAIDTATGASEIYSKGHRNPGGLTVDGTGALWSAEHGPEGGDEINRLAAGGNYGWPLQTYGTHYGLRTWPPDPTVGRHDDFDRPALAFVPSVATSSLEFYSGAEFPAWEGDLLLATLKDRALYRLHVREGRVVVSEPMPLKIRMRDLTVDAAGRIWIKDDTNMSVLRLTAEPVEAPSEGTPEAVLAEAGCSACHNIDTMAGAAGPPLGGVIGREIGAVSGYAYSDALAGMDGVWTAEAMAAYLADPDGWAPGTIMPGADITAAQIDEVVAALAALGPE